MKHLFRLALKYVTRQKLRTLLMFLSVVLSVFVLNTFLVYSSSFLKTIRNLGIEEEGEWEADMSGVLDACEDGRSSKVKSAKEAANIITNHVAVEKYQLYSIDNYRFSELSSSQDSVGFFDIETDNGTKQKITYIFRASNSGTIKLPNYYGAFLGSLDGLAPDEAIVPQWLSKAGYKAGDTVTLTITPESGYFDENADYMKAVRKGIKELNETSQDSYYVIDGEDFDKDARNGRSLKKNSLLALIDKFSDINDVVLKDRETSTPVKVTFKIAGFDKEYTAGSERPYLKLLTSPDTAIDLSALESSQLDFTRESHSSCKILTNQNSNFEDNMVMLLKELGFTDENAFDDFKFEMHGYGMTLNSTYLLTSLRSIDGIAQAVPFLFVWLILIVFVWLFSRFIIDNAFEISVQERSVQFAALRVMGASKGQLATLVLAEGMFYILTALPLGVLTSTLACKYVFDSLRNIGFDVFEFSASPMTILICSGLCLMGIFISTYTSAIWAARKLSPVEALNYGNPKSKKASKHHRKSKLKLSSKRFMIRYTVKNIIRTKRRFFISSVAMALGVLMFTLCLQLGTTVYTNFWQEIKEEESYDFYLYSDATEADDIQKQLMGSGNFSDSKCTFHGSMWISNRELEKLADFVKYPEELKGDSNEGIFFEIMAVDRNEFERGKMKDLDDMNIPYEEREKVSFSELLGMTYEEFENGKPVLILPQMIGYDDLKDCGYGYSPLDKSVTLENEYGDTAEIGGIAHAQGFNCILMPISQAKDIINSGKYMGANMHFMLKDAEHYPAAKKSIEALGLSDDNVSDYYRIASGLNEFVKTIVEIALIFMLSIWLCGIISMMNTINTSALNRSKELLMMRAVGMTRRQLSGTVVLESLLFSSVSAVAGTILSIVGFHLIMHFIFRYDDAASSIMPLLLSILANVVIAFLAALPGIRTLNRSVSK